MPSALTIRLFGPFEALLDGRPLPRLHLREGERLLSYLTIKHGIPVPYADLARQFWPAEAQLYDGSRGDFSSTRQAVRFLRQALGKEADRLGSVNKGVVVLDLEGAQVDLVAFDEAVKSERPEDWLTAVDLYRGPLLDGWTDKWAVEARIRRQAAFERTLHRLAIHATERRDWFNAERFARRLIASTPSDAAEALLSDIRAGQQADASRPSRPERAPARGTVALLYKRGAKNDERVMRLLKTALEESGYRVFIDRDLRGGVEWAREIEREIHGARAVAPLLSEESIRSEMLEMEVEQARDASASNGGVPILVPVRVAYEGALPDHSSLAAILHPLHYLLWSGPEDDEELARSFLAAVEGGAETLPGETVPAGASIEPRSLEPVGGSVPLDSRFYITRPTDARFREALERGDSLVLLKGARQMGKTSLLARGLQHAREQSTRVVLTDLQALDESRMASTDLLLKALAVDIALQLDLDISIAQHWDPELGPNLNLELFLRRHVLKPEQGRLVWGLDEVDRLFAHSYSSQVFGLFRSWHNRRSLDPSGPWSRLTLAIAYATEAQLFISDLNQSPFNVGTRLELEDFTLVQVEELNRRYGSPLRTPQDVAALRQMLGGQPYLTRRAFDDIATGQVDLATLAARADHDDGPFGDHLRRMLAALAHDSQVLETVRTYLVEKAPPPLNLFYRLRSGGLLSGAAPSDARFRCPLYATYLTRQLL